MIVSQRLFELFLDKMDHSVEIEGCLMVYSKFDVLQWKL